MLKILGKSTSINVRKVLWTCVEIGIPFTLVESGSGTANALDTQEFLALNPNGMVPVLIDGDHVLWESNTICRYLASQYQRCDLLPSTPMERAQIEKWMDWQATELNSAWRYAFMATVRKSAAHTNSEMIAVSVQAWNRQMQLLDDQLRKTGSFVNGSVFSLADIVLGLSVNRWLSAPIERPVLDGVYRYVELLSGREGFLLHGRNGNP
jgi:glutathione S-transferase